MYISINYADLQKEAQGILIENDRGGYTVPNPHVYPFQWNWDSLFVALGWLTFDEARAWTEIDKLLEGQWENGMIPSIVFHQYSPDYFPGPDIWQAKSAKGVDVTGITQMPVVVSGVVLMYKLAKDRALATEKMTAMYKSLYRYQEWCYKARRFQDTGLCEIFHGWESMDNSPMWDKGLSRVSPTDKHYQRKDKNHIQEDQRPRQWDYDRYISIVEQLRSVYYDSIAYKKVAEMSIVDAAFNGVVLAGNDALLSIVDEFGTAEESAQLNKWKALTTESMEFLWDDELGSYVDYDAVVGEYIREDISGGLIPLYAGIVSQKPEQYRARLRRWISQDMPSVDIHSDKFEAMRYWRGPSWTIMNFLIYYGTLSVGWHEEAEEIKQRSLMQIVEGGFYENFNPLNRRGGGGTKFSWTAASFLYWLNEESSFDFEKIKLHT